MRATWTPRKGPPALPPALNGPWLLPDRDQANYLTVVQIHLQADPLLGTLSAEAVVLVVGHRGRGAVASRVIGSVGLSVVLHAACTVTVVHDGHPSR